MATFLWEVIAGRRLYWKSDLSDFMYPLFHVWADGLKRWDFSALLWSPQILAGHPVLAEGQMGAFYPPNWLLLALPPAVAVSGSLVLSYSLTLAATFWFARVVGMSRSAALASGTVFAFGGFAASHVIHANIVAGVPWLPVVLGLTELGFRRRERALWLLAGFSWGVQWLTGHPQVPVMTALMTAALVGARALTVESAWRRRIAAMVVPLALIVPSGLALAAVYLLPLLDLGRVSVRPGGVMPYADATFSSLEPQALVTAILPFFYGAPEDYRGPGTFYEFGFSAGGATLILAAGALAVRPRRRWALFFTAIATASLILALGRFTPAYQLAHLLPGVRSLRVPARFVFLLDFSLAMLAGLGLDALAGASRRAQGVARRLALVALGTAGAALAMAGMAALPSAVVFALTAALLCACGWLRPTTWRMLGVLLLLADLRGFWTRAHAYHRVTPEEAVVVDPALAFVAEQPTRHHRFARIVQGDILTSNHSTLYGLSELGGFASIPMARVDRYVSATEHDASARLTLLSVAAVRYVVVHSKLHRRRYSSHEGVDYLPNSPVALLGRGVPSVSYVLPGTQADEVRLVCSLAGWQTLAQGSEVARLTVRAEGGAERMFPLRKGIEVIEPEEPSETGRVPSGDVPKVADRNNTVEGRPFLLYYVRLLLGHPFRIARLTLDLVDRRGRFGLYGLSFARGGGGVVPLSPFEREGFRPIHRTDRSVIFENEGALDRAYAVHSVRLAGDGADALKALRTPGFDPSASVVLEDPGAPRPSGRGPSRVAILSYAPTRVELDAVMGGDGYVVLSDAHHPGWRAFVDGVAAQVYHANSAFRAVHVPDGRHRIVFRFEPVWLRVGAAGSLLTLAAGAAVLVRAAHRRGH